MAGESERDPAAHMTTEQCMQVIRAFLHVRGEGGATEAEMTAVVRQMDEYAFSATVWQLVMAGKVGMDLRPGDAELRFFPIEIGWVDDLES